MNSHPISKPVPRADGKDKSLGRTQYIADFPKTDMLCARFYRSAVSRGKILKVSFPELPAGYHIIGKEAVPFKNCVALIKDDWPAFADEEVRYVGQIMYVVAGPDPGEVDRLISLIRVEYEEKPAAVTLNDSLSLKGGPIHDSDNVYSDILIQHGDSNRAFETAIRVIEGVYETGFQEQLYLEPQGLTAWPEENGGKVVIKGSLQCPYYVKHAVEAAFGEGIKVRVIQTTTGGGFGGKEDYPEIMGVPLAAAALRIGKPLRMIFDRTEDMAFTSKRHPSRTRIRTAHDETGKISGIDIDLLLNGGAYESYSTIVLQRALFHATGVYNIPNVRIRGRALATNTVPSGAFRGFGAPQSLFAIESHLNRICTELGSDPLSYRAPMLVEKGDRTVTGGSYHGNVILPSLIESADKLSGFSDKFARYGKENGGTVRRGIGISLFNHGCGFTGDGEQRIIKAEVALRHRTDGKVEILVASIDMGQGPTTTFRKLVSRVLGIPMDRIVYENPDTDAVPDSGPTVASRTMMIVGNLVVQAAEEMKRRLAEDENASDSDFSVHKHYVMPPGIEWDQDTLEGDAYAAYGWGVNVIEVELDTVSYECRVSGSWGVYDAGVAIDEKVVNGQIQGGMSQALGYGYLEFCETDERGVFKQRTMADYIVPTSLDFPRTHAETIDNPYEHGPFGAKGAGEMVHDGGHAAFAIAVSQASGALCARIPVTPERILELMNENR